MNTAHLPPPVSGLAETIACKREHMLARFVCGLRRLRRLGIMGVAPQGILEANGTATARSRRVIPIVGEGI